MAGTLSRPRDVIGGLLVAVLGGGFLLLGRELETGTSFRMGPGYFPTVLSVLLLLLGLALAGLALRRPMEEGTWSHLPWRGIVLVIGAVLLFGLTLRGLGLLPVLVVSVLATAWASRYASWRSSLPLALGLGLFCTALFIKGLGLPLPMLGPWLTLPASAPAPAPAQEPAPATRP